MTLNTLVATVAQALCGADEQRHLRLENRTGDPCRSHSRDARVAVEAVLAAGALKHLS